MTCPTQRNKRLVSAPGSHEPGVVYFGDSHLALSQFHISALPRTHFGEIMSELRGGVIVFSTP